MQSKTVNIHEAKTHLSKLVDEVASGQETVIAKAGKPVARLVPYGKNKPERKPGFLKGKLHTPEDFDAPLPDEILDAFEGKR
jgi:prevent-host-death family protein